MALGLRFVLTGAKRVFDSRAMYPQVVVTDDCNLICTYCDEYKPGAPIIPLEELKRRIDRLDQLGVEVYDFGEPLMPPGRADRHDAAARGEADRLRRPMNAPKVALKPREAIDVCVPRLEYSVDTSGWNGRPWPVHLTGERLAATSPSSLLRV